MKSLGQAFQLAVPPHIDPPLDVAMLHHLWSLYPHFPRRIFWQVSDLIRRELRRRHQ
jgi:hypothetical protein